MRLLTRTLAIFHLPRLSIHNFLSTRRKDKILLLQYNRKTKYIIHNTFRAQSEENTFFFCSEHTRSKFDDAESQTVVLLLQSHQTSCDLVMVLFCYKCCRFLASIALTLTVCLNVSYLLANVAEKIKLV